MKAFRSRWVAGLSEPIDLLALPWRFANSITVSARRLRKWAGY